MTVEQIELRIVIATTFGLVVTIVGMVLSPMVHDTYMWIKGLNKGQLIALIGIEVVVGLATFALAAFLWAPLVLT